MWTTSDNVAWRLHSQAKTPATLAAFQAYCRWATLAENSDASPIYVGRAKLDQTPHVQLSGGGDPLVPARAVPAFRVWCMREIIVLMNPLFESDGFTYSDMMGMTGSFGGKFDENIEHGGKVILDLPGRAFCGGLGRGETT